MLNRTKTIQVIGRGYLGNVISSGLNCFQNPISIKSNLDGLQKYLDFLCIASGPSSSVLSEYDRKNYEEDLKFLVLKINRKNYLPHLVYISSGGTIYGEFKSDPFTEECNLRPTSQYALYQLNAESILKNYYNGPLTILRLSNAYGPNQYRKTSQGFISAAIRAANQDRSVVIYGDGKNIRDYIHEKDIISSIFAVCKSNKTGIFNISTGTGTSQIEIISIVEKLFNKKLNIEYQPARDSDLKSNVISPLKFTRAVGWTPKINIISGIKTYSKAQTKTPQVSIRFHKDNLVRSL